MIDPYSSQRAMRHMRRAAMQRGVVAVLDIGTYKVAALVLKVDPMGPEPKAASIGNLGGQAGFRVIGAGTTRSRGVRLGEIAAMTETETALRTALQAAQKMAQTRVDHVIVCVSGGAIRSYGLAGEVDVEGNTVVENDISRVMAACDVPDFGVGRDVLHAQPINFALDHRTGLSDPRGQIGQQLACDMHMVTVDTSLVQNICNCLKRCDVELAGIAASGYASGMAALVEDEKELGAACIDLGAGTSGVSIFIKKHMIFTDTVRLGGAHVTLDIAKGLQVDMTTAERIKTVHGGVQATSMDDREMIEIGGNSGDWEKDRRTVSRAELIGIMRPRIEEILEDVRARLDAAGFGYLPSQQVVLTGGGAQIPGIDGLAARIFGQQVRLGRPVRVRGLPQAASGPAFSGSVGLSLLATSPQDEWWDFDLPTQSYPARSLRRAVKWFKDNW
ncbi:cell division protein FtsA [Roseinatronobacter sp. S2]|uniref:cell division protein FtsA n=1 Tax=Roseinatronobacter sp. S2 TaxID=3035471 RepID=UPI00240EDC2D|nr:cell division protein FtsA [Roseinatronobacter sp. S2]WFE74468.1 cell division protein FtsA [Roseinatronobacter sp. S2]